MTQKSNSRVVIDTNKHGIRRETNLDKVGKKAIKKKQWEANLKEGKAYPHWKKKRTELNEVKHSLSTEE